MYVINKSTKAGFTLGSIQPTKKFLCIDLAELPFIDEHILDVNKDIRGFIMVCTNAGIIFRVITLMLLWVLSEIYI